MVEITAPRNIFMMIKGEAAVDLMRASRDIGMLQEDPDMLRTTASFLEQSEKHSRLRHTSFRGYLKRWRLPSGKLCNTWFTEILAPFCTA